MSGILGGHEVDYWYSVSDNDCAIQVKFISSRDRFWPPEILKQQALSVGQIRGRRVVLTGPGAVWMYAHAAATLRAAGASEISVHTPNRPGTSEHLDGCESKIVLAGEEGSKGALLLVRMRPSPPLSPSAIDRLVEPRLKELSQLRSADLVLSGRASVEVYARAASTAVDSGARRITCWSARDGLVVVYDPDGKQVGCQIQRPDWLTRAMPRPVCPKIVGVTGDPNVGKSVFCGALDSYGETIGCDGWKLDCDGQSPTPAWYLSLITEERANQLLQLDELRKSHKRAWTPEMEAAIVEQLQLSRDLFSVLIADLPGGNHQVTPPERVPEGRERIFAQVDLLILLEREDAPSEKAWRDALRPHHLDRRIVAVLTSRDPKGPPSLVVHKQGGVWRGEVTGLDRSRQAKDLAEAFREGLDQLWPALLDTAQGGLAHV